MILESLPLTIPGIPSVDPTEMAGDTNVKSVPIIQATRDPTRPIPRA